MFGVEIIKIKKVFSLHYRSTKPNIRWVYFYWHLYLIEKIARQCGIMLIGSGTTRAYQWANSSDVATAYFFPVTFLTGNKKVIRRRMLETTVYFN